MGADLLLAGASIPYRRKPAWKDAEKRVDVLEKTMMARWPMPYQKNWAGHWDDLSPISRSKTAAGQLTSDLDDFRSAWLNGGRSSMVWRVGNRMLLVTGGMSWGDSPGDLFDSVNRLNAAGVLQAAGFDK